MRVVAAGLAFLGFAAYGVAYLIVAVQSDPTWWWFAPIYGSIEIFQESVWWGLFHIGGLPVTWLTGALAGDT